MPLRLNRNLHKLNLSVNKFHSNFFPPFPSLSRHSFISEFIFHLRFSPRKLPSLSSMFIERKARNVGGLKTIAVLLSAMPRGRMSPRGGRRRCLWGYNGDDHKNGKTFSTRGRAIIILLSLISSRFHIGKRLMRFTRERSIRTVPARSTNPRSIRRRATLMSTIMKTENHREVSEEIFFFISCF
jgi:hypothetical protein